MGAGWTPGFPVGLPFRGFCSDSLRGRSAEAAVAGRSGLTGLRLRDSRASPLCLRRDCFTGYHYPVSSPHCCSGQTTIRQENFAACAARPPAGFEVRRFVRVLSLETASLAGCLMNSALRLLSAPHPPACAGESATFFQGLATREDICRQAPLPSGPQCPAIVRPAEPCREPLFTFSCEEPPRSSPGRPGAAWLKGRRFRPARSASLDCLLRSPKRVQQCLPFRRNVPRHRPGGSERRCPFPGVRSLAQALDRLLFPLPGVADPADDVVRRTSQPPPGFLEAFASASSETFICGIFTDTFICLQNHPPSFTPSVPAHSNRSCSSCWKNILSWGCQRRLFIVFCCGVHSRRPVARIPSEERLRTFLHVPPAGFLNPSAVCSSTELSACCIRHPILRFFVFHRGANPGFPRKGFCPSKSSPRTKRRPEQVSLNRPWEHVRVWIFRSSTFTVFLALAFLLVRAMFPSCGRAEPQGVAPRPGPLPSAPFPMHGPDPSVGLAGLACSGGRLSPDQSLLHQRDVRERLSRFRSVPPPGVSRGVGWKYSKKRARSVGMVKRP